MARGERIAGWVLVAALAAAALRLAWASRHWPLIHDAPLMHYIAWLMDLGAVPYRDVFDMNTPGAYVIHWAVLRTMGGGDAAWRVFDLAWLALTAAVLVVYARPLGAIPALIAGLLFAVYHLAGGPWLAGQRDFFVCPFLIAGAALVASGVGVGRLALAGTLAGAAIVIKPVAVLFVAVLAAVAVAATGQGQRWWRPAVAVLAGGIGAPLASALWLAWLGALPHFVLTQREYVLPLYARLARVSAWTALGWWPFGRAVWTLLAALVAILAVTARADLRKRLALAGVSYGVVHFVVQGKGWEYHLYPLGLFACLAAGLATTATSRGARRAGLAALAALTVTLGLKGAQERDPAWIAAKATRVERLVTALRARVGPGDTVQVLDTGDVGIHALYRLRIRQPTRFIYDFPFLHDEDAPVVRGLRAEFVGALAAAPPTLVVVLERGWPRSGYERHDRFPELVGWLESTYRLDADGDGFRIYAKRARS